MTHGSVKRILKIIIYNKIIESSSVETACIIGTYGPTPEEDSCSVCAAGSSCTTTGLDSVNVGTCPDGSFCPSPFKFYDFDLSQNINAIDPDTLPIARVVHGEIVNC